jgi:hypothetical protein
MAGWLYVVDGRGLWVAPAFYERMRKGQTAALRELAKANLTVLYRERYNRLTRRQMLNHLQPRLFPEMDPVPDHERVPDHVVIPFVRGRSSPPAWLPDYVTYHTRRIDKRAERVFKHLTSKTDVPMFIEYKDGGGRAVVLKPNPKFELVVINKHDRDVLLKLLGEADPGANVAAWITERTKQSGATTSAVLYADYKAWCQGRGEAFTGTKSFAQALVAAGVVKLNRGGGGMRYELSLRGA